MWYSQYHKHNSNNYQNVLNYGAVKDVVPQQINEKLPQNVQNFDAKDTVGNNTAVKSVKNTSGTTRKHIASNTRTIFI